ncbi:hypothetical protein CEXT_135271 [Caerostris extrusa]|uniref:Uncharacterized protein n=1 Tax=Caerostris extrusa TaxID=172846 RepID=A0AAV4P0W0_CAEEX|nr:hypothetical protein CEXT_135271 [Caerostris extrusa]
MWGFRKTSTNKDYATTQGLLEPEVQHHYFNDLHRLLIATYMLMTLQSLLHTSHRKSTSNSLLKIMKSHKCLHPCNQTRNITIFGRLSSG